MNVYRNVEDLPPIERACAVGSFDGVHLGHKALIARAKELASSVGLSATVVTFEPHPLRVVHPDGAPLLLTELPRKIELLEEQGVDEVVVLPFTRELASWSAEKFCQNMLLETLGSRFVVVGKNFNFGKGARGNADLLDLEGSRLGFKVEVADLVLVGGEIVSSSRIRDHIAEGDVGIAAECLGHNFVLEGLVVKGDGRGRALGVPTANIVPEKDMIVPCEGIYAARSGDNLAAVSIGTRPTFRSAKGLTVEAHLLDIDEDLYGNRIGLEFVRRLRDEIRFDSETELIEQMKLDIDKVRQLA